MTTLAELVCPEARGEPHDWLDRGHEIRCTYCQRTIEEVLGDERPFAQSGAKSVDAPPPAE